MSVIKSHLRKLDFTEKHVLLPVEIQCSNGKSLWTSTEVLLNLSNFRPELAKPFRWELDTRIIRVRETSEQMTVVFDALHGKVKRRRFGNMMFLVEYFGKEKYEDGAKWIIGRIQELITVKPEDLFLLHVYMRLFGMYQQYEILRPMLIPVINRIIYAFRSKPMTFDTIVMITTTCAKNQNAHLLLLFGVTAGEFHTTPAELDTFIANIRKRVAKRILTRMAVVSPSELPKLLGNKEPAKKKKRYLKSQQQRRCLDTS